MEHSVEDIGAIVDFEEEGEDSEPETNTLVNNLNNFINIPIGSKSLGVNEANDSSEDVPTIEITENEGDTKITNVEQTLSLIKGVENFENNENKIVSENDEILSITQKKAEPVTNHLNSNDEVTITYQRISGEIKSNSNHYNKSLKSTKESQQMYENEKDINTYENCSKEENQYEEINFKNDIPKNMLNTEDNYINFHSKSQLHTTVVLTLDEKCCQTTNIYEELSGASMKKTDGRRWSMIPDPHSETIPKEQKRWSLKSDKNIKSILKIQSKPKKSIQSVNFRTKAKVKTFREPSSASYEAIDVVDYMTTKGDPLEHYDVPKNHSKLIVDPSEWKNSFECEGSCNASTQTEENGIKETCKIM